MKKLEIIILSFMVFFLTAGAAVQAAGVTINEIRIDQPGNDYDEYFELTGASGTSLNDMTYIVIGDFGTNMGVIEAAIDLTGMTIPSGSYFLAAENTFSLGSKDLTTNLNFENSDNVNHFLVSGFTGANGDDLDTDDDGILDVTPWTDVIDSVALLESQSGGDLVYTPATVGPDGGQVPAHVFRCPGGWEIGLSDPASGDDTPRSANKCQGPPPQDIPEFPSTALPGLIGLTGYFIVHRLRRR